METVKLAEEFMLSTDGLVVGLDLSGDPTVSETKRLSCVLTTRSSCVLPPGEAVSHSLSTCVGL